MDEGQNKGKPRAGAAGKYFGQVPSVPDYILGQGREGENRKVKRVMHEDPISGRMVPTVQYTRMQDKEKQLIQQMVTEIQGQSSIVVLMPWDGYCCTGASMTLQPQTVTWSEQERLLIISDEELHSLQMTVIGAERASGQYWTIHGMMHDVHILAEV